MERERENGPLRQPRRPDRERRRQDPNRWGNRKNAQPGKIPRKKEGGIDHPSDDNENNKHPNPAITFGIAYARVELERPGAFAGELPMPSSATAIDAPAAINEATIVESISLDSLTS